MDRYKGFFISFGRKIHVRFVNGTHAHVRTDGRPGYEVIDIATIVRRVDYGYYVRP